MTTPNIFKDCDVMICVGSGGVGKTTMAAALGVRAAQSGKRVLVLTIDPAKRLAQTLGIEGHSDIVEVPGAKFSGALYAGVIEHKKVFDEFVLRAAGKDSSATKLLQNRLYKQLSTGLSGSQEFTSLEKLYSCYESKSFDLIILDTPPTKHALDFLAAPQKLAALFNEGIAQWFKDPEGKKKSLLANILNAGTKQVLKVLESLTGASFVHELADFFISIEKWQSRLQERTTAAHRLLVSSRTHFCLVTAFDKAKLKEAEFFSKEIRKGGYHLRTLIVNRAFPSWLKVDPAEKDQPTSPLQNYFGKLKSYYADRELLYANFDQSLGRELSILKVPDLMGEVSDIKSLVELSELLNIPSEEL